MAATAAAAERDGDGSSRKRAGMAGGASSSAGRIELLVTCTVMWRVKSDV
jgi:hypothetical protein